MFLDPCAQLLLATSYNVPHVVKELVGICTHYLLSLHLTPLDMLLKSIRINKSISTVIVDSENFV
jgi:hypothetical protein